MLTGTQVLTSAQMRAIETAAMDSGQVTGLDLMERAGKAVVAAILHRWPEYEKHPEDRPHRALVLCGPGNNGGDGFVVARLLAEKGWEVRVNLLGNAGRLPPDARTSHDRWCQIGPVDPIRPDARPPRQAGILVDALFGIGLSGPVDSALRGILDGVRDGVDGTSAGPRNPGFDHVVAIDVPSGLCADSGRLLAGGDPHVRGADLTVTFHSLKPGHLLSDGPDLCGTVVVAPIGLAGTQVDPPCHQITGGRVAKRGGHKFDHGSALVIAGPSGQGGAARLAARAALRVGAGLVTIAAPRDALDEHAGRPDALMRRPVDDAPALRDALADPRIGAVCIGPGGGVDRTAAMLAGILTARRPAVLDADALTALSRDRFLMAGLHDACILTPHPGEFARLFPDLAERLDAAPTTGPAWSKLDAAREAAARCGAVLLLKGPDTVIAHPDGRAVIHSAFDIPWLATAGAGDVLAGIVTGLLARGFPPLEAAGLGALIHAKAARAFGPGLIADDLPDLIPQVLREMA